MRQAGVLSRVLPESERWGIDAVHPLAATERDLGWAPDPLLRLMAMVPPDRERMEGLAARLKLSRAEGARLAGWAAIGPVSSSLSDRELGRLLYDEPQQGVIDRLRLAFASARQRVATDPAALAEAASLSRLLERAASWQRPVFPLRAADLSAFELAGPQLGEMLKRLEKEWADGGFDTGRDRLVERAGELVRAGEA